MTYSLPPSIQQWLTALNKDGKSIHTQQAYERGVHHFLDWYDSVYEAELKAESIMARDIRDWQVHQQQIEQSAPATVNQHLSAVKGFFKWHNSRRLSLPIHQRTPPLPYRSARHQEPRSQSLSSFIARRETPFWTGLLKIGFANGIFNITRPLSTIKVIPFTHSHSNIDISMIYQTDYYKLT